MRPLTLEVHGFTSFRDAATLDFADDRYFAFVGPTGSGKSSLIDAMIFALYGRVPRLDARSVFPVINQGSQEARVSLTFAIGDETYTAARVVRRVGADRATTKEARLERGTEVLAGDADGVTAEVERVLGLTFDEFTRCVVLPQGEFARFMHDKPATRQELLVRLLGLEVYERMMQRAGQRATDAEAELRIQQRRLAEDLSFASEDDLKATRAAVEEVERLRARIDEEAPGLDELRDRVRAAKEQQRAAAQAVQALTGIRSPDDVAALAAAVADARAALDAAEAEATAADDALRAAEDAAAALPARATLERALAAHARRTSLEAQRATAEATLALRSQEAQDAAAAAEDADRAHTAASAALEEVRTEHRAHELARTLAPGEPCPVCRRTVDSVPSIESLPALDSAQAAVAAAETQRRTAGARAASAAADRAAAKAGLDALVAQLAETTAELAGAPPADEATRGLAAVEAAEQQVSAARASAQAARADANRVRGAIAAAEKALVDARRTLDAARDGLATLSPPPLAHDDLAADWETLLAWASGQLVTQQERADALGREVVEMEEQGKRIVDAQRRACTELGIEPDRSPRDACVAATARLRAQAARIEDALEAVKDVREQIATLEERSTVAAELKRHLTATNFERWVLGHALGTLVDAATEILLELSDGQYTLALDKQTNFSVVDHRNANLERSARTLSGGETFLASLALALAVSDRIAQLSANSSVRLESIFLDEGFGTLDPETLDTVAAAMENLSARNRVVGLVTHVRDLAERVPVRFEVRKGPTTSTVDRVPS